MPTQDAQRAAAAVAAMSSLPPLPIDQLLPEVAAQLLAHPAVVVEAPPGAGKTTRLPHLLLNLFPDGEIVVLEPRRLAAHLSAARVAEERGERLGDTVGVQMRFNSVCGPATRLRYVTEGVLVRQLQREPTLPGVRAVILDEFHERHLASDLSLALLRRLQSPGGARPDLKLCVMSATMNGADLAAFLGGCPRLESSGRTFPVEIEYVTDLDDEPLWKRVRGALRKILQSKDAGDGGDVLVFLPGSAEIRRCQEELAELAGQVGLEVLPLHGDLPFEDQRRAVAPRRPGALRKVILATNVAETSLTIDGVTAVIDSGLARVAGHQPWSGLPTLRVQPISRAQATQRAGRAGRTRPGRCLRLYSRLDHDARPEFEAPEIRRLDLCELVLTLAASELPVDALSFLDPPSPGALEAAQKLLGRLGALDETRARVTPLGQKLIALPLHPRLGRLLVAAAEVGLSEAGAVLTALLGERDLRAGRSGLGSAHEHEYGGQGRAAIHGPSDVLHLLDLFEEARAARFNRSSLQRMGLDADVAQAAERAGKQLTQAVRGLISQGGRDAASARKLSPEAREQALMKAILCAYPDRVARRRSKATGSAPEFALAGGGGATLAPTSIVRDAELVVLVDVEERGQAKGAMSRTLVRMASAIAADWLLDLPGNAVHETSEVLWNSETRRVEVTRRLQYEQLILDEERLPGDGRDEAQVSLLVRQVLATELKMFGDGESLPPLLIKLELLAQHCPELGIAPPDNKTVEAVVRELCRGHGSLDELRGISLCDALCAYVESNGKVRSLRAELGRLTPDHVTLGRGRRVKVHYDAGKPPWVESRMQDFFGMADGPRVLGGRVAVVLHLLAPNKRAVQVTTDLSGFWSRHYPAIRRELCRRYPRHAWPEDPTSEPTGE